MTQQNWFVFLIYFSFGMIPIFAAAELKKDYSKISFNTIQEAAETTKKLAFIFRNEASNSNNLAQFLHDHLEYIDSAFLQWAWSKQSFAKKIKPALLKLVNGNCIIHQFIRNKLTIRVLANPATLNWQICFTPDLGLENFRDSSYIEYFCNVLGELLSYEKKQVNLLDSDGKTPLHCALDVQLFSYRLQIIDLLLKHGADPDLKNDKCLQSPREYAAQLGFPNVFNAYDQQKNVSNKRVGSQAASSTPLPELPVAKRVTRGEFNKQLKWLKWKKGLGKLKEFKNAQKKEQEDLYRKTEQEHLLLGNELTDELSSIRQSALEDQKAIEFRQKQLELSQLRQQEQLRQEEEQRRSALFVTQKSEIESNTEYYNSIFRAYRDGQASRDQKITILQDDSDKKVSELTVELLQLQAMTPSKGPVSSIPSVFSFGSRSSTFFDEGKLEVELALTPRELSKVTYVLGGDNMAKSETQRVNLDSRTRQGLRFLEEGNPLLSHTEMVNAIPCDSRVEGMRTATIRLNKRTLEQLSADNYNILDHAMSSDFIRKVIQSGSVYGQLRQNKQGAWVFNVLIVASIKESKYAESFTGFENIRKPKNWVTLGFGMLVETGEVVVLGDVYHFCVQETHPRYVKEADGSYKYLLCPLGGLSGAFDNKVLRLRCLKRLVDDAKEKLESYLNNKAAYEAYWNSLK